MPNVPYPYEVNGKLVTGNGSLIPISSLSNRSLLPSLTVISIYYQLYISYLLTVLLTIPFSKLPWSWATSRTSTVTSSTTSTYQGSLEHKKVTKWQLRIIQAASFFDLLSWLCSDFLIKTICQIIVCLFLYFPMR